MKLRNRGEKQREWGTSELSVHAEASKNPFSALSVTSDGVLMFTLPFTSDELQQHTAASLSESHDSDNRWHLKEGNDWTCAGRRLICVVTAGRFSWYRSQWTWGGNYKSTAESLLKAWCTGGRRAHIKCMCAAGVCVCAVFVSLSRTKLIMTLATVGHHNNGWSVHSQASSNKLQSAQWQT